MGGREVEEEEGRGEGKGICVWLGFLHRELDIWGNVFHFVESGICIFSSGFGLEIGIIIHQGNFFSFSFLVFFYYFEGNFRNHSIDRSLGRLWVRKGN